jgi:hypothetical protein
LAVWKNLHHLTSSPTKDFSSKNEVSENWTERGREGFIGSEKSDRKGKKISILI